MVSMLIVIDVWMDVMETCRRRKLFRDARQPLTAAGRTLARLSSLRSPSYLLQGQSLDATLLEHTRQRVLSGVDESLGLVANGVFL